MIWVDILEALRLKFLKALEPCRSIDSRPNYFRPNDEAPFVRGEIVPKTISVSTNLLKQSLFGFPIFISMSQTQVSQPSEAAAADGDGGLDLQEQMAAQRLPPKDGGFRVFLYFRSDLEYAATCTHEKIYIKCNSHLNDVQTQMS